MLFSKSKTITHFFCRTQGTAFWSVTDPIEPGIPNHAAAADEKHAQVLWHH